MQDTSLLLQDELRQGSTALPTVDTSALMPLIITSIAITALLTLLFLVYVIFGTIRRYKVEKATLDMQKDIRRMRELMEQGSMSTRPHQDIPRPTGHELLAHTAPDET